MINQGGHYVHAIVHKRIELCPLTYTMTFNYGQGQKLEYRIYWCAAPRSMYFTTKHLHLKWQTLFLMAELSKTCMNNSNIAITTSTKVLWALNRISS